MEEVDKMALIKCPNCGKEISDSAEKCPNCGATSEKHSKYTDERKNRKLKKINIVLSVVLLISLICNGIQFFKNGESKNHVSSDSSTKSEIDVSEKTETVSKESTENKSEEKEEDDKIEKISVGDQVDVNTQYGDFKLIIEHVRKCDWVSRSGDDTGEFVAILVECDVQNESFTDPYNTSFWLATYLNVMDNNNYVVDTLNFSYDDGEYLSNPKIPVGGNSKVCVSLKAKSDIEHLNITINNQYNIIADIEE